MILIIASAGKHRVTQGGFNHSYSIATNKMTSFFVYIKRR